MHMLEALRVLDWVVSFSLISPSIFLVFKGGLCLCVFTEGIV